jgi:hypothetical protein
MMGVAGPILRYDLRSTQDAPSGQAGLPLPAVHTDRADAVVGAGLRPAPTAPDCGERWGRVLRFRSVLRGDRTTHHAEGIDDAEEEFEAISG